MESDEIQIDETGPDFLLASLETYLTSSAYCDAVLICADGRHLRAHQAVLASISPFIKQVLLDDVFPEHKHEYGAGVSLHLPEVTFEELTLFLQLAYTGRVNGNSKPGDEGSNRRNMLNLLQTLEVTEDILEYEGTLEEDEKLSLVNKEQFTNKQGDVMARAECLHLSKKKPSTSLGSVSLLKVDKPKQKERAKIPPTIAASISPAISNLSNSSMFLKRNKCKSTNVHVEFAPTLPTVKSNQHNTTSLIKQNIISNRSPISSNLVKAQNETLSPRITKPIIAPSSQPLFGAIDEHGFIYDKELADKKTREILDRSRQDNSSDAQHFMDVDTMGSGNANALRRKQERCQCPNCMDPNRDPNERRAATLHSCHYADCGKKYKKTSHLRAHLRWHVGDQPFMCSWKNCGKRFTRSDELHRHFRIHTGEKNHQCSVCEKCFARSDHLKKHMLSHGSTLNMVQTAANTKLM